VAQITNMECKTRSRLLKTYETVHVLEI